MLNNSMIEKKSPLKFSAGSFVYSTDIIFHSVPNTLLDPSDPRNKTNKVTALGGKDRGMRDRETVCAQTCGREDRRGERLQVGRIEAPCERSGV